VPQIANLFTDCSLKALPGGPTCALHLESAAFLGHIIAQEPDESSGHCRPRVPKPLSDGFWLALIKLTKPTPQTRGCLFTPRQRLAAKAGALSAYMERTIF
jgi:hypothetical protein